MTADTIHTVQFVVFSDLVNRIFKVAEDSANDSEIFWDLFHDSCDASFGDASRTLVRSSKVFDAIAEIAERVEPTIFFDEFEDPEEVPEEAEQRLAVFKERCKQVQQAVLNGPEYIDLEG
jgi:hypothetical protein